MMKPAWWWSVSTFNVTFSVFNGWLQLSILMVNVDDLVSLAVTINSRCWKRMKSLYILQICSTRPKLAASTYSASQLSGCFCSSGGQYFTSSTVTAQDPSAAMSCIKVGQTEDKNNCHSSHVQIFSGMKYAFYKNFAFEHQSMLLSFKNIIQVSLSKVLPGKWRLLQQKRRTQSLMGYSESCNGQVSTNHCPYSMMHRHIHTLI